MTNKFVTIEIEGEENIGIIDLGLIKEFTSLSHVDENTKLIKAIVEPKLIEALESHFDCPVKTVSVTVISSGDVGAIEINAHVLIESDGEDHYEDVVMNETWVY